MVPEDIDEIYRIYEAPEMTYYMQGLFEDREEEYVYIQSYYNTIYKFYGYGTWLITLKNGRIIGRAGIENNPDGEFELGYMLEPEYQHQGYALEACEGILKFAEQNLELDRADIVCYINRKNISSIKLAKKLGITIKFLKSKT